MNRFYTLVFAVSLMGCASTPSKNTSEPPPSVNSATNSGLDKTTPPAPGDDKDNSSRVLNKNKSCPKNSKMVNGKCTLQVESDD
jgi:hypothetical protein